VETSTYCSELVASRIATELILEIRCMLRLLGVALDEPALMLGNSYSMVCQGVTKVTFTFSDTIPFCILILPFLYTFVKRYGPVQVLSISGEFRVFLITLGLQTYIHKELTLVLFLIGLIYNVLFYFLYLIPIFSEGNIVYHISAKHKFIWCCLQCCVIVCF
jgi:hypothetical protein